MIEIDEEKNPLWKPGTYPYDSGKEPRGVSVHLYG